MPSPDAGWPWLDPPSGDGRGGAGPVPGPAPEGDLAGAFARCFRGDDGRRVVRHLRAMTVGRTFGPDTSEALLRHAEGQRQLVAYVLAMIARGGGDVAPSDPIADPENEETRNDRNTE